MVQGEADVGIEAFLTTTRAFTGLFKHRYSDFIVREVDLAGNEARLTSVKFTPTDNPESSECKPQPSRAKSCPDMVMARLTQFLSSAEKAENLVEAVDDMKKGNEGPDDDGYLTVCSELDKDKRKQVHQVLSSCFPGTETRTFPGKDGQKLVQIIPLSTARPSKRRRRGPDDASRFKGYLSFVLYKENTDTTDAVSIMGQLLRIPPSSFTFAGTKDRRAVTTQNVRVKGISPQRLEGINKALRSRVRVGNFVIGEDRQLRMGQLHGNSFSIILRDIQGECSDEDIQAATTRLMETGFVNYFGLQRFGSGVHGTHQVGFSVLKGDFETANRLILDPLQFEDNEDRPDKKESRKNTVDALTGFLDGTKTPGEALELLPSYRNIERMILESYAKPEQGCTTNHQAAFMGLPRNLRTLYTHAVQSFLFNAMATKRAALIQNESRVAIAGDLVLDGEAEKNFQSDSPTSVPKVRHVTAEEAQLGSIPLEDVVLPIVGTTTILPTNSVGEHASAMIEKHGMKLESGAAKKFGVQGDYRHFIARPEKFSAELIRYASRDDSLAVTDLMILENVALENDPEVEKNLRGLRIDFTLKASQYATICLRELTKQDSSSFGRSRQPDPLK